MAFGAPHGTTVVQFRKGLEIHAQQRRARPFAAQMEMAVSTASWGVEFRDKRGIMGAGVRRRMPSFFPDPATLRRREMAVQPKVFHEHSVQPGESERHLPVSHTERLILSFASRS